MLMMDAMSQTLLRGMPAIHACWIVLMSLASTTAYRPNITKLAPQTMETKRLKETYGRVCNSCMLHPAWDLGAWHTSAVLSTVRVVCA